MTTIEKIKAYLKKKKKFGDSGCFVITREIQDAIGFEPGEINTPLFWDRFISAVQDTYPETERACYHYTFGEPQEVNVTDEDAFSNWLEVQKHLAKKNGERRILALHHINKFKEKILLRGLFGTYRGNKLHVFVFEESFGNEVPFLVEQFCENAGDLKPEKPVEPVVAEPEVTLISQELDSALDSAEKEPEIAEVEGASEPPVEESDSQAVIEPLPSVEKPRLTEHSSEPTIIQDMPRLKSTPTRNYLRDAYGLGAFNTGVERIRAFKVYDKKDAPANAIFVATKIERDGVIDLAVPSYDYLKPNEKLVHLYKMPDK